MCLSTSLVGKPVWLLKFSSDWITSFLEERILTYNMLGTLVKLTDLFMFLTHSLTHFSFLKISDYWYSCLNRNYFRTAVLNYQDKFMPLLLYMYLVSECLKGSFPNIFHFSLGEFSPICFIWSKFFLVSPSKKHCGLLNTICCDSILQTILLESLP